MSKRYISFNEYFKYIFGEKVIKLSLDGGFTCPNRDGKISTQGCIFCSEKGSGDFSASRLDNIELQIQSQINLLKSKWESKSYIAYFQNFTNTYKDIEYLKELYNNVIKIENIVGLSIATRADCLSDEVLDLLEEINKKTLLWLELGLQSVNEETIELINRGYTHKVFHENVLKLKERNIKFLLHLIFGLPNESKKEVEKTLEYVKSINPFGVKIHSLYIQNDSPLYNYYLENKFPLLTKDDYVKLVCDAIEFLPDNTIYHRLTGDPNKEKLVAPLWTANKLGVLSSIDKELKNRRVPLKKFE